MPLFYSSGDSCACCNYCDLLGIPVIQHVLTNFGFFKRVSFAIVFQSKNEIFDLLFEFLSSMADCFLYENGCEDE